MEQAGLTLPLSVVIATTQPWPEVGPCLDSLHQQVKDIGAEIILADGTGQGLPEQPDSLYPGIVWLKVPGASVFYLRALAMSHARGEIVAVTEDHCRARPNWCEKILEVHRKYPDTAVIGGAVENGATETLMDWASFFIVNGAALSPLDSGERSKVTLQANVSYKRHVIPKTIPELGRMEWIFNQHLRSHGEKLRADDSIIVEHVQSLGFHGTCMIHFHDSRSIAGFRLEKISPVERMIRLAACFIMPPALLMRTLIPLILKNRHLGIAAACLPALAVLVSFRGAGAFVGFITGPGNSPQQIR